MKSCPRCDLEFSSIPLNLHGPLAVAHCSTCGGLFFEKEQLRSLIMTAVADEQAPSMLIELLPDNSQTREHSSGYLPCPICKSLMNKDQYGERDAVTADVCPMHGLWLDREALRPILAWRHTARSSGQETYTPDDIDELFSEALAHMFANLL